MLQEIITYLIITVALGVVALRVLKKYAGKKEDESCTTGERPESKGCGGCDAACPIKEKRASQHSSLY